MARSPVGGTIAMGKQCLPAASSAKSVLGDPTLVGSRTMGHWRVGGIMSMARLRAALSTRSTLDTLALVGSRAMVRWRVGRALAVWPLLPAGHSVKSPWEETTLVGL